MRCVACGFENPADASFCGECAAPLAGTLICPSCGKANPARQKFCNGCGRSLGGSADRSVSPDPRSYTPKHLVEKILTTRSALEGERKQVTVLFADVKGSMELGEKKHFSTATRIASSAGCPRAETILHTAATPVRSLRPNLMPRTTVRASSLERQRQATFGSLYSVLLRSMSSATFRLLAAISRLVPEPDLPSPQRGGDRTGPRRSFSTRERLRDHRSRHLPVPARSGPASRGSQWYGAHLRLRRQPPLRWYRARRAGAGNLLRSGLLRGGWGRPIFLDISSHL
jgi:hypothetical protein